jgi:DNA-binding PadR family transcriptional regulator
MAAESFQSPSTSCTPWSAHFAAFSRLRTQTLRDLERDGLITRHVFPTKPPGVEYRLAPLGQSLLEPMASLIEWADRRYSDIHAARVRFDGRPGSAARQLSATGSRVLPVHKKVA